MIRKVFETGASMVVSLPKEMLDHLHVTEGNEVSVELDAARENIIIAPVTLAVAGVDANFACLVADFIENHRPALEELAQ